MAWNPNEKIAGRGLPNKQANMVVLRNILMIF